MSRILLSLTEVWPSVVYQEYCRFLLYCIKPSVKKVEAVDCDFTAVPLILTVTASRIFYTVTECFLSRNWLDQMTTTNRIILSQALIIIRSKRNTFIIRNQNKRKSSLYLVTKFKNFNINLLLWRVVTTTTVSLYGLADSPGKRISRQKNDNKITSFSLRFC